MKRRVVRGQWLRQDNRDRRARVAQVEQPRHSPIAKNSTSKAAGRTGRAAVGREKRRGRLRIAQIITVVSMVTVASDVIVGMVCHRDRTH